LAATPKKRNQVRQNRREIAGVALIALGLFLGICVYVKATGLVGIAVTDILFGLCGMFSYVLPVALLAGGIVLIAISAAKPRKGRTSLILLGIWVLLAFLHVLIRPIIAQVTVIDYIKDAWTVAVASHQGGGILGGLMCYPLILLFGEAGTYIFLIAAFLIDLLFVTKISIARAGQKVKTKVQDTLHSAAEKRAQKQKLYTEQIDAPAKPGTKRAQKQPARKRPAQEQDDPLDFIPLSGPIERAKKRPAKKETLPQDDEIPLWKAPAGTPPTEPVPMDVEPIEAIPIPSEMENEFVPVPDITNDFTPIDPPEPVQPPWEEPKKTEPDDPDEPGEEPVILPPPPYTPPPFSLLNPSRISYGSSESPAQKAKLLVETLESFHVSARVIHVSVGPVITRFELQPAPGVRVNRITALSDDIALALAAPRVRIEAPIPGKAAVGIEIPNKDTATVVLRDIVESREFQSAKSPISLALGKDIAGKVIVADLHKMPHMLIAGSTGSGKSVCINDLIISMVYKASPSDLRMILIDPKVVELSAFSVLPHLLIPVVTDPKKAAGALKWAVNEMVQRYQKFSKIGARDLARYNELQQNPQDRLPKIVIIIDELADLMMVAPDEVEDNICRIAQLGRASGLHLIIATQRPSADVITGLIKANVPSRCAFAVASAIDSRIILDCSGAEKLLGRGDMLFHANGAGKPVRVQGAFVSDEEVERIVEFFKGQQAPQQFDEQAIENMSHMQAPPTMGEGKQDDELLPEAVRIVLDSGQASISMIQRRLRVGYARAARLVDIMEQKGFVSGFEGSKPRKVLITREQYASLFGDPMSPAEE